MGIFCKNLILCSGIFVVFAILTNVIETQAADESFLSSPRYHHYHDVEKLFENLEKQYNGRAKVHSIGLSTEGRKLLVLQISNDVNKRSLLKPMFKYVGNMHGDETVGRELIINLAEYMLINYGKDSRVTKLMDNTDIYLMPSLNPDGFEHAKEGKCSSLKGYVGRNNANGQDLNRDFPDQFIDKNRYSIVNRQAETKSMIKWILSNPFVLSANMHGGAVVASYPFDDSGTGRECCQDSVTPDNPLVKNLATIYAQANPVMRTGDACPPEKFPGGVTNGANWYELKGGMQDFNYVWSNCVEITFELSCCKYPVAATLPKHWHDNKESLLRFMEQVHKGVKGAVVDLNNNPIAGASIIVANNTKIIQTTDHGEFWRLLLPGSYVINAAAPGFKSSSQTVKVGDGEPVVINFTLTELQLPKLKPEIKSAESLGQDGFVFPVEYKHHSNSELGIYLEVLSKNYPSITRLYSIGKSVNGQNLWVLEITRDPGQHIPGKPEVKYVANMHGNEVVGREMLLLLAKYLCENYLTVDQVTRIVNNTRIHILPSLNPDGYDNSRLGDSSSLVGRSNAHNVDLNRNFPDQYEMTTLNSIQEPETRALMAWTLSERFVLSANLHGGALVANYPFDNNPSNVGLQTMANLSPDNDVFEYLAKTYSNAHRKMHLGEPCLEHPLEHFPNGITNGAAWYSVSGGMQDWNYLQAGCFELTLELGCYKYPQATALPELWLDNKDALLVYLEQAQHGVHGLVRSSISSPLPFAEVTVHGKNHLVRVSSGGDYFRLLLPGTYNITASAYGYESQTAEITVPNTEPYSVSYNFTLMRNDPQHWSSAYDFRLIEHVVNTHYHDRSRMSSLMAELENGHPDIVEFSAGDNEVSMEIHSLRITDQVGSPEEKKFHVLFIGGFFGSEAIGRELVLNIAQHLTTAFKIGEPKHIRILKNMVVHVIPSVDNNFDKVLEIYKQNETLCDPLLNEPEFGDKMVGGGPDKLVDAFKHFLSVNRYDLILNFASGGMGISYPKVNNSTVIYDKLFKTMLDKFSSDQEQCSKTQGNQNHEEITNRLTNLIYQEYDTPMVTIRASCCRMPRQSDLGMIWRKSLDALMAFLELSETGIEGIVLDSANRPLRNAVIHVKDLNKSFNVTKNSAYYKIMLPTGTYEAVFSADGFEEKHLTLDIQHSKLVYTDIVLNNNNAMRNTAERVNLIETNKVKPEVFRIGGLNGFVLDSESHPIANAIVVMQDPFSNTTSDSNGNYFLSYAGRDKNITITVSAPSFESSTKIINSTVLSSDNYRLVFRLERVDRILGMPRLVFVIVAGCVCVSMVALASCCYANLQYRRAEKKAYYRQAYAFTPLAAQNKSNILLDDDQDEELFRLPLKGEKILQPYFDDEEEDCSDSDSDEDVILSTHPSRDNVDKLIY